MAVWCCRTSSSVDCITSMPGSSALLTLFPPASVIPAELRRELVARDDATRLRDARGLLVSGKGGGALEGDGSVKSTIPMVDEDAAGAVVDRERVTGIMVVLKQSSWWRKYSSNEFLIAM